jgi:DNA-binding GntR family transcriptional regulator
VTIDRDSYQPVYRQLADLIRVRITSGEIPAGSLLQSELALAQEHGVGRDTVRRAMAVLRGEGLVLTDRSGTHVRKAPRLEPVTVPAGATIKARMPTEPERRSLGIPEAVPVLDVDGRLYPADRYQVVTAEPIP